MKSLINWLKRNPVQTSSVLVAGWFGLEVFEVIDPTEEQSAWVLGFVALLFGVPAAVRSNWGRESSGGWFGGAPVDDGPADYGA